MGFRTAKRLNAQYTFYIYMLTYHRHTRHIYLIPLIHYPLISLHQYLFTKTLYNKDNFLKLTAAHRS